MALDNFRQSKVAEIERELAEARELDCSVPNCPLRWSVQVNGHTHCSGHAWSHKSMWDTITQENHHYLIKEKPSENPPTFLLTKSQQLVYLQKIKAMSEPNRPNKDWAKRLKQLHDSGRNLSKFQIHAYKTALKLHLEEI